MDPGCRGHGDKALLLYGSVEQVSLAVDYICSRFEDPRGLLKMLNIAIFVILPTIICVDSMITGSWLEQNTGTKYFTFIITIITI